MANNKIIYGGKVLIDLTGDTVAPEQVLKGKTFHDKSGATQTGTCTFDSDTASATATEAEILEGKTAFARKTKLTGTMKNNGAVTGEISTKEGKYTVPIGYHDGSGKVGIAAAEQAKLIPGNIRQGITVLGVVGTMSGTESVKAQTKTVAPSTAKQTVAPDEGFNYLSSVTIEAIPYQESSNAAGGTTVTIAGAGGAGA